jgi:hypothetical protein
MRYVTFLSTLAVSLAIFSFQAGKQVPPSVRGADQAVANGQVMEPPVENHTKSVNMDLIKSEASEMQKLADTMPSDADQIAKGVLPKDMANNLKRIEKLAHHMHAEVSP